MQHTTQQLKIARKTLRNVVIDKQYNASAFCKTQQVNSYCVYCSQNDICTNLYIAQQRVLALMQR